QDLDGTGELVVALRQVRGANLCALLEVVDVYPLAIERHHGEVVSPQAELAARPIDQLNLWAERRRDRAVDRSARRLESGSTGSLLHAELALLLHQLALVLAKRLVLVGDGPIRLRLGLSALLVRLGAGLRVLLPHLRLLARDLGTLVRYFVLLGLA